jgi:pimeloyl-ACP methyl ester carboxylesterase
MFVETSDAKLQERLTARAQRVDAEFRRKLFLDLIRWDLDESRDALAHIAVPTLLLQSTYVNTDLKRVPLQPGMTTPWMDAVASLVPQSQAKIIAGAGHFPMIEAGQSVNAEIRKFAAHFA